MMDDYRTRRLDSESEEPEPFDEEQVEEQAVTTPPPVPEEELPPPVPEGELEAETPPPLPEEKEAVSSALPKEEGEAPGAVVYTTPEPEVEQGSVVTPMAYDQEPEERQLRIPSPFEEAEVPPSPEYEHAEAVEPPYVPAEPVPPQEIGGVTGGGVSGPGPSTAPPQEKKSNTGLIITIVVVVLLLLCCCCVFGAIILGLFSEDMSFEFSSALTNVLLW